ncbi:hypothetical protein J6590_012050 [Homalodisca vitripennis]|nr:hypothetical protein J6590_012050 [Homalodisca vitripennis]
MRIDSGIYQALPGGRRCGKYLFILREVGGGKDFCWSTTEQLRPETLILIQSEDMGMLDACFIIRRKMEDNPD